MIEDQSNHLLVIMEEETVIEVTVVRKEAGTVKNDKNRVDQKHHVSVSEPQQKGGG